MVLVLLGVSSSGAVGASTVPGAPQGLPSSGTSWNILPPPGMGSVSRTPSTMRTLLLLLLVPHTLPSDMYASLHEVSSRTTTISYHLAPPPRCGPRPATTSLTLSSPSLTSRS